MNYEKMRYSNTNKHYWGKNMKKEIPSYIKDSFQEAIHHHVALVLGDNEPDQQMKDDLTKIQSRALRALVKLESAETREGRDQVFNDLGQKRGKIDGYVHNIVAYANHIMCSKDESRFQRENSSPSEDNRLESSGLNM